MDRPGEPCCLSCGGAVAECFEGVTADFTLRSVMKCAACGPVEFVVFDCDDGRIVKGFMTQTELSNLPGYQHDDGEQLPF